MSNIEVSPLTFMGFKIDKADLRVNQPTLGLITSTHLDPAFWAHKLDIRKPAYFKQSGEYVGGIEFGMAYFGKDLPAEEKKSENALIELKVNILGVFKAEKMEQSVEQKLIKTNIPFILLPHLRAAVMNIFASAGYGTVVVPLINVIAMAEKRLESIPIDIIE